MNIRNFTLHSLQNSSFISHLSHKRIQLNLIVFFPSQRSYPILKLSNHIIQGPSLYFFSLSLDAIAPEWALAAPSSFTRIFVVFRSHTTTHHSQQNSSGRVISSSQRPLPDNTQHSRQTNIHAPGGIRTLDLSRLAAVDLRLRPRGHWDRLYIYICVCVCVCVLYAL